MTPRFLPFSVGRPWHLVGRLAGRQRGVSIIGAVFLLLLMSLLATLYPAWRASSLQPARELGHG